MPAPEEANPDGPWWNPRWLPFAADDDWTCGFFIDTGDHTVGEWGDYGHLATDVFPSLAAFFEYALTDLRTSTTWTLLDDRLIYE
ncbi:hypothetical protein [Streptomyces sp. NPDC002463]|uniref:hypothetical protein n=1 Tax=Streptomyces sp. NPDC002463 TaxID=3364645 RepID=UPI0036A66384